MVQTGNRRQLAISVENVAVAYQRRAGFFRKDKYWALKDVSFDVYHGETLGVIGRNGVGKSTLLRLLAGLISPDKGRVVNHGVSATLLSLQVGFVQYLTGQENAILSGMMLGLSKDEILAQMDNIRLYADIGEFFDQPVHGYSSGMRARLGFSVAIYVDPDVVLLDEVLGVGDELFRVKSLNTIKDLVRSEKSVILVSHQPAIHRQMCDRLVWIEGGVVQDAGEVETVLEKYLKYHK
jgi:lipopolysaccharide transport system ATP-binding protein